MWGRRGRHDREDDPAGISFLSEEIAEERRETRRDALRWTAGFALLFAGVAFAFWWSGNAVRFGAARVAATAAPSWRISGVVLDARTGHPVPWAEVGDHPAGRPPFFRSQADHDGAYTLLTLAEPHKIRVTAPGYHPEEVQVGRPWFLWMPRGEERRDIRLAPE